MIVYKVLAGDKSQYLHFQWPIPLNGPTKWLNIGGGLPPVLCQRGYHGWLTFDRAKREADFISGSVFEMELEGPIAKDNEKAASLTARLTKLLYPIEDDSDWKTKLEQANTVIKRIALYREAEKVFGWSIGTSSYQPLVPARHGDFKPWLPNRCGTCGLSELWHFGIQDDDALVKELRYDWKAIEVIRLLRSGMPLE